MKKFLKERLNVEFLIVTIFALIFALLYFILDIYHLKINSESIGGSIWHTNITMFELIVGNSDVDKHLCTYASILFLIIIISIIVINLILKKKKNVINICLGAVLALLFIVAFIHIFVKYKDGIELGGKIIKVTPSICAGGYIFIILVLLFIANSIYVLLKNRKEE